MYSDEETAATNWTIGCKCPEWSTSQTEEHVWKSFFMDYSRGLARGHLECGFNQFLSGLTFELGEHEPWEYEYSWHGRCTNLSVGFTTHEDSCWVAATTLEDRRNGSFEIENPEVVIRKITVRDDDFRDFTVRLTWSYELCLVLPGKR